MDHIILHLEHHGASLCGGLPSSLSGSARPKIHNLLNEMVILLLSILLHLTPSIHPFSASNGYAGLLIIPWWLQCTWCLRSLVHQNSLGIPWFCLVSHYNHNFENHWRSVDAQSWQKLTNVPFFLFLFFLLHPLTYMLAVVEEIRS